MAEPRNGPTKKSAEAYTTALKTATNREQDPSERVKAFAGVAPTICDDKEKLDDVIKVLQDAQSPQAVRFGRIGKSVAGGELQRRQIHTLPTRLSDSAQVARGRPGY